MIVKLVEIYEDKTDSFTSNRDGSKKYLLREVYVNPEHVVVLRPSPRFNSKSNKVVLPEGLHPAQEFTTIHVNKGLSGLTITAVGEPSSIEEKLSLSAKRVLKG